MTLQTNCNATATQDTYSQACINTASSIILAKGNAISSSSSRKIQDRDIRQAALTCTQQLIPEAWVQHWHSFAFIFSALQLLFQLLILQQQHLRKMLMACAHVTVLELLISTAHILSVEHVCMHMHMVSKAGWMF